MKKSVAVLLTVLLLVGMVPFHTAALTPNDGQIYTNAKGALAVRYSDEMDLVYEGAQRILSTSYIEEADPVRKVTTQKTVTEIQLDNGDRVFDVYELEIDLSAAATTSLIAMRFFYSPEANITATITGSASFDFNGSQAKCTDHRWSQYVGGTNAQYVDLIKWNITYTTLYMNRAYTQVAFHFALNKYALPTYGSWIGVASIYCDGNGNVTTS